jgi:PqqD family protein of HPr-rel-A system
LTDEAIYRADPPELRQSVALGELTAIYHRPSGQTHVVAEPVPAILDALSAMPLTLGALLTHLDAGDDQATRAGLAGHLDMLLGAGLVWRA